MKKTSTKSIVVVLVGNTITQDKEGFAKATL